MSLLKIAFEKLPPSQRSSLENKQNKQTERERETETLTLTQIIECKAYSPFQWGEHETPKSPCDIIYFHLRVSGEREQSNLI